MDAAPAAAPAPKAKTYFVGKDWTPTLVAPTHHGGASPTAASSSSVAAGGAIPEEPVLSAFRECDFPSSKMTAHFLLNLPYLNHVAPYSDPLVRQHKMMPCPAHPKGVARIGTLRWCPYCDWIGRMMVAAGSADRYSAISGWQDGEEHFARGKTCPYQLPYTACRKARSTVCGLTREQDRSGEHDFPADPWLDPKLKGRYRTTHDHACKNRHTKLAISARNHVYKLFNDPTAKITC